MLVGTAVPTIIAGTKVSLATVLTTLVGTAVSTIFVGATVPSMIAGLAMIWIFWSYLSHFKSDSDDVKSNIFLLS